MLHRKQNSAEPHHGCCGKIQSSHRFLSFSSGGQLCSSSFLSYISDALQVCSQKEWEVNSLFALNAHTWLGAEKRYLLCLSCYPFFHSSCFCLDAFLFIACFLRSSSQFQRTAISRNTFLCTAIKGWGSCFNCLVFSHLFVNFPLIF